MWRNWQTRQTQNLVLVRVCGFDPLRRHHPVIFFVTYVLNLLRYLCFEPAPVRAYQMRLILQDLGGSVLPGFGTRNI